MPKTYKRKTPYKRPTRRVSVRSKRVKKARYVRRIARVPRSLLQPFPDSRLVRHKYCDTISLSAGTGGGAASTWIFRTNSLYDPDYTGVGHQPMFHDEMAAQYKTYTVLRSWIRITFPNEANIAQNLYLWADSDVTTPPNHSTLLEQHAPRALGIKLDAASQPLVLTGWYDLAKWSKTTRAAVLSDDDKKTLVGYNPAATHACYYILQAYPNNPAVTLGAQRCVVQITYEAMWRDPVDHVGS